MSSSPPVHMSVAEVKRHFADVIGAVRYRHERYVIERNGTPVAAIVPIEDLEGRGETQAGFLALVGAFEDAADYVETLEDTVRSRATQRSRSAPRLLR